MYFATYLGTSTQVLGRTGTIYWGTGTRFILPIVHIKFFLVSAGYVAPAGTAVRVSSILLFKKYYFLKVVSAVVRPAWVRSIIRALLRAQRTPGALRPAS